MANQDKNAAQLQFLCYAIRLIKKKFFLAFVSIDFDISAHGVWLKNENNNLTSE